MVPAPYLLYLGNTADELSVKTSRGLAQWRRELCIGQYRHRGCPVTLCLTDMSCREAVQAGARTLCLGIASAGGVLDPDVV